jgi:hypothetical protein
MKLTDATHLKLIMKTNEQCYFGGKRYWHNVIVSAWVCCEGIWTLIEKDLFHKGIKKI